MKKIIKEKIIDVNETYEILHSHYNFQRQTDFVAYNKKSDTFNSRHIRKGNDFFDWRDPLSAEEIEFLISK